MGNETCGDICHKETALSHDHDDIQPTEYIVPCQICNQQFKAETLKHHIDITHYATIAEDSNGTVMAVCLLCGKAFPDLLQQGHHITEKHPYADGKVSTRTKPGSEVIAENSKQREILLQELNKSKKEFAKKLNKESDFQILKQLGHNHYEASVKGVRYEVLKFVKDYRGFDYEENLAEAELVWNNIFKTQNKYRYYFFDVEPGHRNIVGKAYLFMISQQ